MTKNKVYQYTAAIKASEVGKGGAYVVFPYDIREEFGVAVSKSMSPLMVSLMMAVLLIWALKIPMVQFVILLVSSRQFVSNSIKQLEIY